MIALISSYLLVQLIHQVTIDLQGSKPSSLMPVSSPTIGIKESEERFVQGGNRGSHSQQENSGRGLPGPGEVGYGDQEKW
ncbi:hypothetical protein QQP08_018060, partial [Theobroma cacao]